MATTIVALFDGSLPEDWSNYNSLDGNFLRGAAAMGGSGGSATHTHIFSAGAGNTTHTNDTVDGGSGASSPHLEDSHQHPLSAETGITSETGDSLPIYIDVALGQFSEEFDES